MTTRAPCTHTGSRHLFARYLNTLLKLSLPVFLFLLNHCQATQPTTSGAPATITFSTGSAHPERPHMWMTIGEHRFAVTLTKNPAAQAFAEQLPMTLEMAELNGNEKHANLPKALPANAGQPGTLYNGDLMLYGSRTLVIFYVTFDSPYSYTRLGHVDNPKGLAEALGKNNVKIIFSKNP